MSKKLLGIDGKEIDKRLYSVYLKGDDSKHKCSVSYRAVVVARSKKIASDAVVERVDSSERAIEWEVETEEMEMNNIGKIESQKCEDGKIMSLDKMRIGN